MTEPIPYEAVDRLVVDALDKALDNARDTSSYRWPQQQDVPPLARAVLDALARGGYTPVPTRAGVGLLDAYDLLVDKLIEVHASVVMDTPDDRAMRDPGCSDG